MEVAILDVVWLVGEIGKVLEAIRRRFYGWDLRRHKV
jgi:hypothetical protein